MNLIQKKIIRKAHNFDPNNMNNTTTLIPRVIPNIGYLPDIVWQNIIEYSQASETYKCLTVSKLVQQSVVLVLKSANFEVTSNVILEDIAFDFFEFHGIKMNLVETSEFIFDRFGATTRNGKYHSLNGLPSIVNGYMTLYHKNGKLHRDGDLPAGTYSYGVHVWAMNDCFYRSNGLPTQTLRRGDRTWHVLNPDYPKNSNQKYLRVWSERCLSNGSIVVNDEFEDGDQQRDTDCFTRLMFFNTQGQIHCEDGPAIVYENGRRLWLQNGEPFRAGGLPTDEHWIEDV